jgi:hypothetical protein
VKVGNVLPCICTKDVDFNADGYNGMPILRVFGGGDRYFDAKCPKCGRGGLFQFKSAYLALRDWNEMQTELREQEDWGLW